MVSSYELYAIEKRQQPKGCCFFVPASKAGSPALGIAPEARPADDEARAQWRSGQNRSALQADKRFWAPQE